MCLFTLVTMLPAQVDFDTEVLPILTKAGCNSGACHGAAAGRGDFRLSLFGSRPELDYDSMVREREGRRIHLVHPEQSLLLAKPTLLLTHEGGQRLVPDSREFDQLLAWLREGAVRRPARRLVAVNLETPFGEGVSEITLADTPAEFTFRVWATFQEQDAVEVSRRDVTRWAIVVADDPESLVYFDPAHGKAGASEDIGGTRGELEGAESGLEEDRPGRFRVLRGGRHVVTIRFLDRLETLLVTAPLAAESPGATAVTDSAAGHWIDEEIQATLVQLRLPASPRADPWRLLRRVTIDLTGRLPTLEELAEYESAAVETRYEARVDRLLASVEAEEYWTAFLTRLLRLRTPGGDREAMAAIHGWLRQQWQREVGWDETVRQLLVAEGDSRESGPAAFYRMSGDPRSQAEFVSETLWGIRLRCANCHDHPLDRWTQDDYHGLAAIFARLDTGPVVRTRSTGDVIHPATGEAARPRLPGGRFLAPEEAGRERLAEWSLSGDPPPVARALVNRVWKSLMGRGLIEPVDDLRDTNPPTHPRLLARLEDYFRGEGYRIRPLIRAIVLSESYRRGEAIAGNRQDDRFYSHRRPSRLGPEVLADAMADVTGVGERFGGETEGTRAVALMDPTTPSETLDRLGRCTNASACEDAGSVSRGLATQLHLLNGPLLNEKLRDRSGHVHRGLARLNSGDDSGGAAVRELIAEFYRRALGRRPDEEEALFWERQFAEAGAVERAAVAEDFLWGLLNCQEFVTNH